MMIKEIAGFTFSTDGSRLICEKSLRAVDFLQDMDHNSIDQLSQFILSTMDWIDPSYSKGQKQLACEAYQSIYLKSHKESRDSMRFITRGTTTDIEISNELTLQLCIIFEACSPYLFSIESDSATDGFYNGQLGYQACIARNYKELVQGIFGSYSSNFPELDFYTLRNLAHSFQGSNTPIDHIAAIARHIATLGSAASDYLPFAFHSKDIGLSPKRFIHWCESYGAQRALELVLLLVEVDDIPNADAINSASSLPNLEKRCARSIQFAMEHARMQRKEEYDKDKQKAKTIRHNLERMPDISLHNYAIYSLRSAVELANIGNTLGLCIGSQRYVREVESGEMQMYLVDADSGQYVVHIEDGDIQEIKGYRNIFPEDDIVQVASKLVGV